MRFRAILVLATAFMVCFTVAAWSSPTHFWSEPTSGTQSATGRISSIGDGQFSLDTVKDRRPRVLQILIDENTRIEGQLIIGAQVAVEYRKEGEKMVATRVMMLPAGGSSL